MLGSRSQPLGSSVTALPRVRPPGGWGPQQGSGGLLSELHVIRPWLGALICWAPWAFSLREKGLSWAEWVPLPRVSLVLWAMLWLVSAPLAGTRTPQ